MRTPLFACWAAVLLLGTGCSSVRLVYHNPAFTRLQLEQGRLAMGAVTALGGRDYVAAEAACDTVQRHFQAKRPWLGIMDNAEVRKQFPAGEYEQVLRQASEASRWTPADVAQFCRLTNSARYVPLMDIFKARMDTWEQLYSTERDADGYERHVYNPVKSASSRMTVAFFIYDLRTGRAVWVAVGKGAVGANRRMSGRFDWDGIIGPSPPSAVEILDRLAPLLGRLLPR